jgi:hypothetical protein
MWFGIIGLALFLAVAWAIARINRRAGFGWIGGALPFAVLVLAFAIFLFQEKLGFPMTEASNTAVMNVVLLIWALQILLLAIRRWPALAADGTGGASCS